MDYPSAQDYEIHIYSQRVEDVDLTRMRWHRIPQIPGPHLINFLWWLAANHAWRWWDAHVRGLPCDLVYTAGTNCWDADLISIHIVFAEFVRMAAPELACGEILSVSGRDCFTAGCTTRLVIFLERRMYTNPKTGLILIAKKNSRRFEAALRIDGPLPVVYIGLDHKIFNPELRLRNRLKAASNSDLERIRLSWCWWETIGRRKALWR